MRKERIPSVILIGLLIISSYQVTVKCDWGFGDCSSYHGITLHYGRYINNPNIILDGIEDQTESWNRTDVYDYTIPMVNRNDSTVRFKSYMQIKYIYDDKNLYILAHWNDSTPVDRLDQFYICWNMNCTNFTVNMFLEDNAMRTNEEGARVDCWKWLRLAQANGSSFNLADECYDNEDWIDSEENRDPIAYYTSGIRNDGSGYYQIELMRPLLTNEIDVDTQFQLNSTTRFSTGVGDGMGSIEHAISWTYELDFNNATDPNFNAITNSKIGGYQIYYMGTISLISSGLLLLKLYSKRRNLY